MLDPKDLTAKIESLKSQVEGVVKDVDAAIHTALDIRERFTEWQKALDILSSAPPQATNGVQAKNGVKRLETPSDPEPKTLKEKVLLHLTTHPDSVIEDIAVALGEEKNRNSLSQTVYQLRQQKLVKRKGQRGTYSYSLQ